MVDLKPADSKLSNFDIIIAGGGMIGATAALAIAQMNLVQPLKIAIIESVDPSHDTSPSFDQRAVALSASSVEILKSLDLWKNIQPLACAITDIHVSDQGRFGFTRLKACDYKMDALGQVIPLDQTGPVLWDAIQASKNITTFCPFKIAEIVDENNQKNITVSVESTIENNTESVNKISNQQLSAKILLAADGTFSSIAKMANIKVNRKSYHQHAVIANIATELPHKNKAYERFTKQGPLALLPLTRNRMSLVWCQSEDNVGKVMDFSDEEFIEKLQQEFGFRLGLMTKVGERSAYPLALHYAEKPYEGRVLLLGNAAHTLHPIAGQGFNLGLRDIAELVDHIQDGSSNEIGCELFFKKYHQQRQADWKQTITATNGLVKLFSNDFLPMIIARTKALALVDKIPFVKKQLVMAAMGFSGKSAQLTRKNINQ